MQIHTYTHKRTQGQGHSCSQFHIHDKYSDPNSYPYSSAHIHSCGMHYCASHGQFFCLKMYSKLQLETIRKFEGHMDLTSPAASTYTNCMSSHSYIMQRNLNHSFTQKGEKKKINVYSAYEQQLKHNWQYLLGSTCFAFLLFTYTMLKRALQTYTGDHIYGKDFTEQVFFPATSVMQ